MFDYNDESHMYACLFRIQSRYQFLLCRSALRNLASVSDNFGHSVMEDEVFGSEYIAKHMAALLGQHSVI
jgi:hypothetical protein